MVRNKDKEIDDKDWLEQRTIYRMLCKGMFMILLVLSFVFVYESQRIAQYILQTKAQNKSESEERGFRVLQDVVMDKILSVSLSVEDFKILMGISPLQKKEQDSSKRISNKPINALASEDKADEPSTKEWKHSERKKSSPSLSQSAKDKNVSPKKPLELRTSVTSDSSTSDLTKSPLQPPLNVLMIGDSMMKGYIGNYIQKAVMKLPKSRVIIKAVVSTGLSGLNNFLWEEKLKAYIKIYRPNLIIVMVGTNDYFSLYSRKKRKYISFQSPEWQSEYEKATEEVMKVALEENILTFWIGLPRTERRSLNPKLEKINSIHKKKADKFANIHYISLWNMFINKNNKLMVYMKNSRGYFVRVRFDGVHLNPLAAYLASQKVISYMSNHVLLSRGSASKTIQKAVR